MRPLREPITVGIITLAVLLVACSPPASLQSSEPAAAASQAAETLAPQTSASQVAEGAPEELKIGIVTFLSGPGAAPFGIPARDVADLLIEELNAGSLPAPYDTIGIAGVPISAVFVDEAGGADTQVAEFRRLVLDEEVDLVIGYISSGDCLAVAPVAEELETLTVMFDCGTQQIFEEADHTYVFRTAAHQSIDGVGAARYVQQVAADAQTIAGINQNYAWGQDSWNTFRNSLQALDPEIEVVVEQFPELGAGQYSSELSALLLAQADIVHSSFWGGDLEGLVIQGAPRGLFAESLGVLPGADTLLPSLGENMPEGVVVGARGPHGALAPENELNDWFVPAYTDRYDVRPVYPAYHMAQAILGVKSAFEAATGDSWPTQEEVIAAFEYIEFETPSGTISMVIGNGHQAVEPMLLGTTGAFDETTGERTLENIIEFSIECVNPPEGTKSEEWISGGFEGALGCP